MRAIGITSVLSLAAAALLMSACASQPEKVVPANTGETKASVEWRARLGDGPGSLHARMTVAVADDTVYMAQEGRGQTLLLNFGVNQCQGITGVANSLFQRGVERGIPDQKTDLTVCQ